MHIGFRASEVKGFLEMNKNYAVMWLMSQFLGGNQQIHPPISEVSIEIYNSVDFA